MISGTPISGETISGTPGGFVVAIGGLALTDTTLILTLPINCVLIGHQEPVSKLMELNKINGPLKGVFGE